MHGNEILNYFEHLSILRAHDKTDLELSTVGFVLIFILINYLIFKVHANAIVSVLAIGAPWRTSTEQRTVASATVLVYDIGSVSNHYWVIDFTKFEHIAESIVADGLRFVQFNDVRLDEFLYLD